MTGEQSAHQETKGAGVQAGYLFVVAPSHDDVGRHASASLQKAKAALAAGALSSAIQEAVHTQQVPKAHECH